MASTNEIGFEFWLNQKLRDCQTDETVFCSYITGILDGEESLDEKSEALNDILSEIIVSILDYFE